MKTIRTTLRIEEHLKKAADKKAIDLNTTLQQIFNDALRAFIEGLNKKKADDLIFIDKPVDKRIGELKRSNYYDS